MPPTYLITRAYTPYALCLNTPRKSLKMKNSKTKLYLLSLRILESRLGVVVMRAEIPSSIGGPVGRCPRARHWPHRVLTFLRQPKIILL